MARPRKVKVAEPTVDEKIAAVEAEIAALNEALKGKKKELKTLEKEKAKADMVVLAKKAKEEEGKILDALKTSGKSVEEILEFLK